MIYGAQVVLFRPPSRWRQERCDAISVMTSAAKYDETDEMSIKESSFHLISSHFNRPHFIRTERQRVRREATQFAVAATNQNDVHVSVLVSSTCKTGHLTSCSLLLRRLLRITFSGLIDN